MRNRRRRRRSTSLVLGDWGDHKGQKELEGLRDEDSERARSRFTSLGNNCTYNFRSNDLRPSNTCGERSAGDLCQINIKAMPNTTCESSYSAMLRPALILTPSFSNQYAGPSLAHCGALSFVEALTQMFCGPPFAGRSILVDSITDVSNYAERSRLHKSLLVIIRALRRRASSKSTRYQLARAVSTSHPFVDPERTVAI